MVEGHASASSCEINLNAAIGAVIKRHAVLVIYATASSPSSLPFGTIPREALLLRVKVIAMRKNCVAQLSEQSVDMEIPKHAHLRERSNVSFARRNYGRAGCSEAENLQVAMTSPQPASPYFPKNTNTH